MRTKVFYIPPERTSGQARKHNERNLVAAGKLTPHALSGGCQRLVRNEL